MKEVMSRLWVGSDEDFQNLQDFGMKDFARWTVVHAAREPYHRKFVGYTGRGAPKESPEYLYAQRGKELALNLFDTNDINYVNLQLMRVANSYIKTALRISETDNVLVHCNMGQSRGPTIAMGAMAEYLHPDFLTAQSMFQALYPAYKPMKGLEDFARLHWSEYYEGTI